MMGEQLLADRDFLESLMDELHGGAYDRLRAFLDGPTPDLIPPRTIDLIDQAVVVVLEGDPRGKGRPKFANQGGFVRVYTDKETQDYEQLIQEEVLRLIGGDVLVHNTKQIKRATFIDAFVDMGGQPLFTGPVRIEMEIGHKIRESWPNKKQEGARLGHVAATIKVDFDNCAKIWCDAFNRCMWKDDTQVVDARIRKFFVDDPYVLVRVIPLDLVSA